MYRISVKLSDGSVKFFKHLESFGEADYICDEVLAQKFWDNVESARVEILCHEHGWAPASCGDCEHCDFEQDMLDYEHYCDMLGLVDAPGAIVSDGSCPF